MDPETEKKAVQWLNALIAMAQWNNSLPFYFAKLFNNRPEYERALELLREGGKEGAVPEPPGNALNAQEWRTVYEKITATPSLLNLFANNRDPFQSATPSQIWLLAEISDLTSDPQLMFYSQNGTFHLVLNTIRQNSELNTQALIGDGFNRFYALLDTDAELAKLVYELACSHGWYPVLASLKDARDYTIDESDATKARLKDWNERLSTEQRKQVLDLFPVPRTLVKLAWERQDLFDNALKSIEVDQHSELSQLVPNVAHGLFRTEAEAKIKEIETDLDLLAVIARHCISTRKFVKLDGLVYSWPRIAALAMANYSGLVYVEGLFLKRKPRPSDEELQAKDARELYDLCAGNKAVIRFLKLRPYFHEIDENELRRYRKLARAVSDTSPVASSAPSSSNISASAFTPKTVFPVSIPTQVCELVITGVPKPATFVPEQEDEFQLLLRVSDHEIANGKVTFSVRKLLDKILGAIGVPSEGVLHTTIKNLFSAGNAETVLVRGGKELYSTIIVGSGLEEKFKAIFQNDKPVRLIVVIPSIREELHCLPWEWFPDPRSDELLLSNESFSLVRSKPVRSEVSTLPLTRPIRMIGVYPNAPIGTRDVSNSSMNIFQKLEGANYRLFARDNAPLTTVKEWLEKFHPHIVHFEGYVDFAGEYGAGLRIFFSKETGTEPVGLPEFESLLKLNQVQLLVIGQNESRRVYENAGPVLASRVVRMAVPTVLAPIRAVDEVTANTFNAEFYQALIRGDTLEQALFHARQKVKGTGADWTPFALFSDPWLLDDFKLLPQSL